MNFKKFFGVLIFVMSFCSFAGNVAHFEPSIADSMRQYGVDGQVQDLFGGPMPRDWFAKPVSAQMSLHSYVAMTPLTQGSHLKGAQLILSNEAFGIANDVVLEVRDNTGSFVEKFMVRIPDGEERVLDMSDFADFDAVSISLFSASAFSAIQLSGKEDFAHELEVHEPKLEQVPAANANKNGYCLTLPKTKITLTNSAGVSVAVWAEMAVMTDTSSTTINKKYLTIYYPYDRVFHYAMRRGWGSHCSDASIFTAKRLIDTRPDHEWVNMEMVLIGMTGRGYVYCANPNECGSETWTFTL